LYLDNINLKAGTGTPPPPPVPTAINSVQQDNLAFSIYPNPANSSAVLSLNSEDTAPAELELTNALGQVVYRRTEQLTAGPNLVAIDCRDLAEGMYLVKVKGASSTGIKKLVVSK
jgi:hypothetical protein